MENVLNFFNLKSIAAALTVAIAASASAAFAADAAPASPIPGMAAYKGADRQQKLVAAAQKEGSVTLYTSITNEIAQKLIADFDAKYGIKVKLWRSGDGVVLQRMMSERAAGHPAFDAVNIGSVEMEMAHREKLLQSFKSPAQDNLVPGAVGSNNEYAATFVNLMLQAYNTNAVKKEELPKSYADLLDPRWKGRLGIEATDEEWFYAMVTHMGEEKGLKYFRDLVATNKPSLRTGHSLLGNLVASGEVPLGLTVYAHTVLAAKKKGAPIDYVLLDPAIGVSFSMGLSNLAPHPNAALLFYEYMLGDGQKIIADLDYTPTNKNIDTPFRNTKYLLTNQPKFLDQYDKWEKLWNDIMVKR
ncbi:extracellular solute-binding protein [Oxalobacteraceae bacterium CAVE-383]|nr:extracellular solute-binding protein [Oxalobacteraceae bacterium CAVE-383]